MNFATAYNVKNTGVIRQSLDDFIVEEIPLITPIGEGEHLWLKIKKTGANTDWVAKQLAKLLNVKARDVGYAGLKDRHGVTTQWFSIYLPGKSNPDVAAILPDSLKAEIKVLKQIRHIKKLRRGAIKGNRFVIVVRDIRGEVDTVEENIAHVRKRGVPNYFGMQRFGNNYNNIEKATLWFNNELNVKNRNQRSIYLSAARSWIFNHILAKRVTEDNWDKAVTGDVFILDGSHSWFIDDGDAQLNERLLRFDIHPSAALWGKGSLDSQGEMQQLETKIAQQLYPLCDGLEKHGLKQERRSMRLIPEDLDYQWLDKTSLQLEFSLPPGAYATTVLNQCVELRNL